MKNVYIAVLFVFSTSIACSSTDSSANNFEGKCLEDCCYEEFSCGQFTLDNGKNPLPFSVKCSKAHYSFETVISDKVCYNVDDNYLKFCCQKP